MQGQGPGWPGLPPGVGGFPANGGRPGYQDYQLVPGTQMMAYGGQPGYPGAPFPPPFMTMQGPSAVFPAQQMVPPFQTMPPSMPAFGSMRYYDRGAEGKARAPGFTSEKLERRERPGPEDTEYPKKSPAMPARRGAQLDAASAATTLLFVLCALGGCLAAALAAYTAWTSYSALMSDKFGAFSWLASGSAMSFFWVVMLVFIVLAALALVVACIGCAVPFSPPKRSILQGYVIGSATLGFVLLALVLVAWLLGRAERPDAVRTANLICQDLSAWSCPAEAVIAGSVVRWLREVSTPFSSSSADFLRSSAEMDRPGLAPPAERRLGVPQTAMGYVGSLNDTVNASAGAGSGESERCRVLHKLCAPPRGFSLATACICHGIWTKPENATASTTGVWNGTEGAYCRAWNASEAPWCFSLPSHNCSGGPYSQQAVELDGRSFVRSGGPCSSQVDSRSQIVLDGYEELLMSLLAPALLGIVLLLLSLLFFAATQLPPPKRPVVEHGGSDGPSSELAPPWDDKAKSLQVRFERAQKQAMKGLRDDTPQEVKMLVYGFYQQAKYGDVRGERPGFFSTKERAKYDAWDKVRGMSKQEAMEGYIMATGLIE